MPFRSQRFSVNGQTLHAKVDGDDAAPVMLFLHGFPEYWAAWAKVAKRFVSDYRVILPDQRGFNLSSKPAEREAYATQHLVADMRALIDEVSPDKPVILCGHDWGASIAYALAMRHPARISHLVIANGVHPLCFQKALFDGGAQAAASQYIHLLRAEGSEEILSANRFEKLLALFQQFSSAPWLTDKTRDAYRASWSEAGALSAMLNWYRGTPMVVPPKGAPAQDFPIGDDMRAKFYIPMPHLLLWGEKDTALLPSTHEELPKFCANLSVCETENAGHWILHEEPDWVAQRMIEFLAR